MAGWRGCECSAARWTRPSVRDLAALLNGLPERAYRDALRRCCGSARWVEGMLARRPFADDAAVHAAAEELWWALAPADWLEAFAQHPRIGDLRAAGWSRAEQAGVTGTEQDTLRRLADGNREYERRFGHVFLICATGLSATEMLGALDRRLRRDPGAELRTAAEEHAKITRLRLDKLKHP